jgi:HEAT repeat protein
MSCRFVVLTALALGMLSGPAWGQPKVLGKTQAEWIKILEEHKETRFRRAAVLALKSEEFARTPELKAALTQAMTSDKEPEVRREVAAALGDFKGEAKDMIDALAQRLEKDDNAKVREAAARSLGRLAEFAGIHVPRLGQALKDADPATRTAAAEALIAFGDKAREVFPQLTEAALDPKNEVFMRIYAVRILAKHSARGDKTAEVLATILSEKSAALDLRQMTATALGLLGPQGLAGVAALAQAFEDDRPGEKQDKDQFQELRRTAGAALGKVGPKAVAALPAVVKVMHDPDVALRAQAVRLTGVFGKDNAEVATHLVQLLKEERNAEVLVAVIQESAELGIQPAVEQLTALAEDPRMTIRDAARVSLKKLMGGEKK